MAPHADEVASEERLALTVAAEAVASVTAGVATFVVEVARLEATFEVVVVASEAVAEAVEAGP